MLIKMFDVPNFATSLGAYRFKGRDYSTTDFRMVFGKKRTAGGVIADPTAEISSANGQIQGDDTGMVSWSFDATSIGALTAGRWDGDMFSTEDGQEEVYYAQLQLVTFGPTGGAVV